MQKDKPISSLLDADESLWQSGAAVHVVSRGAMRPWVCRDIACPLLVVMPDSRQVRDFTADARELKIFGTASDLPEITPNDNETMNEAQCALRGMVLHKFKSKGGVLAATPSSLMAPANIGGDVSLIECGKEVGRDRLAEWLAYRGYQRADLVWSAGQFAVRGSIIDVFSPNDFYPTRIEFFDDEVESIRFFDTETQRSVGTLRKTEIQSLVSGNLCFPRDFFPKDMRILMFDPNALDITAENTAWMLQSGLISEDAASWQKWDDIRASFPLYNRLRILPDIANCTLRMAVSQFPNFRGKLRNVEDFTLSLINRGFKIKVVSETERSIEWAHENSFETQRGILSEGFIDYALKYAVITDLELSGVTVARHRIENRAPADWGEGLLKGQWVVHENHGVSQYIGTETVKTSFGENEYIILLFADNKRLMIPIMQFYKISPWEPLPGEEPKASSLGTPRWSKDVSKAREIAQKAARDLIKIYAKREVSKGFAFPANHDLMREVEDSFVYTETVDQLAAINDVENDMGKAIPMDRLIIGDVGFGKTEIAIRAAAKAAFAGRQTAVMVPTTLLARQHFETFSVRFADTGVRVELLSSFLTRTQALKIGREVAEGKVDIVIGTHMLLSEYVKFKKLGLLVIDEEHRFGVLQKDKMKKNFPGVDVLMLSATPIPRSLSLSLSGLRDMSVLRTPPGRRLPVITVVRPFSENLLKNAVLREINRGGQIFYVHNRVAGLPAREIMLKRLFPKLRIATAHGGTDKRDLERIMVDFLAGEIDILLCTTIVESGLDIPSANTLIADDAHHLGLAQMYQLRGRVGRREEQAYAFFMYPDDANISVDASERLEAIADLDELGAGYRLAQRDLQIRGGGDMIGIAQHGNSSKIGYQRYCDILAEEVAKIKGEYTEPVQIETTFPASIPGGYLPQDNLRVSLYRRLIKVTSAQEAEALREETHDRYGAIPAELSFLFDIAVVRGASGKLGIKKVSCTQYELDAECDPEGLWKKLTLPQGFCHTSKGFMGKGGYAGIKALAAAINAQPKITG
ncbi:MAG: helicase-related protein [Synergistes sp.]|nr:helicase-related protein [Synergistes sp.]